MEETDLKWENAMSKPLLPAVIDYEREIAPYTLSMIYAGLGSGKNLLAGHLMNGSAEYNLPKLIVLLITSRKAKVVETLSDKLLDIGSGIGDKRTRKEVLERFSKEHPFGLDTYRREIEDDPRGWGSVIQRSAACTNAFIEKYHQHVYDPNEPSTHLWNRFDMIIVDEVHSLVTDSTFQHAPFYTWELVQETVKRINDARMNAQLPPERRDPNIKTPVCKHVLLMTGTPEAVRFMETIPGINLLDKREICRNVAPKNLHLVDQEQAVQMIRDQLKAGERIVYFANHITPVDELAEKYGISRERIAMQFSDEKRLKELARKGEKQRREARKKGIECPETDLEKLKRIQEKLAREALIPKDIQLFVTTSKNKEGINIVNKDICRVYIEEHSLTDIRQMAGRLREGAEHAYVIVDDQGHNRYEHPMERWLSKRMCRYNLTWDSDDFEVNDHHHADAMLELIAAQNGVWNLRDNPRSENRAYSEDHPEVGSYVDLMKDKFPYLRYSFYTNHFEYNELREKGVDFVKKEHRLFAEALISDEAFRNLFGGGFPVTNLHPMADRMRQAELHLQRAMEQHPDNLYTTAEKDQLGLELDQILSSETDRKRRVSDKPQANRVVHRIGYHFDQKSHEPENARYDCWELQLWDGKKGISLLKDANMADRCCNSASRAA